MQRPVTYSVTSHRRGFTLVELVVVVLVLGIIAAVATPKMFDTAGTARQNSTRQSLAVIRDAIELYRSQTGSYPAAATIAADLADYIKGPFPSVQFGTNNNANVASSAADPITTPAGAQGWIYNETTGDIHVNDAAGIGW